MTTDPTPEPCGCRVEWEGEDDLPWVIHYCSTHAAAFETKEERDMWHAEAIIRGNRNTDLLAALKETRRLLPDVRVGLMPSPGRHDPADWYYAIDAIERSVDAAIAKGDHEK